MIGLRNTVLGASRITRNPIIRRNVRFQTSSSPNKSTNSLRSDAPVRTNIDRDAVVGGIVGGSLVFLAGYAWYHFSGAKTVVRTANQTKDYFEKTLKKTKESAPPPSEAIQWLREISLSYVSIIPGAKGYVDSAFNDLETVHEKHRDEVDQIVKEAYNELKDLGNNGFSAGSVATAWEILQKHLGKVADLAKDAGGDILNNHPQLKDQFGGEFERLKQMGENHGPEVKRQVDETWNKVRDALKGGFSFDTVNRVKGIVQETTQKVQKIGDEAWQKGMEQAKPYLDKNPQLKELVEENKTKLMRGNAMELGEKIKATFESGSEEDLENYVKETINKANGSAGGGFESYFNMIPGAGPIWSNMSQLQEGAQKHGEDAEKLLKQAMEEVQQVLSRKVEEGKKLAEKAKQDTRK
jgi:hypothetical protein